MSQGLQVDGLRVAYGKAEVLKGVDLTVEPGQVIALVGQSGCGKSTLLRALCGLQPFQQGTVRLQGQTVLHNGEPLYEEWEIRRHVMLVPQGASLLPHLTARANIRLGLRYVRGLAANLAEEETKRIAMALSLGDCLDRYPEELSGGQYQRVALARAACLEPDVLLLDEVTSNIDPSTIREVVEALWSIRRMKRGVPQSLVLVTHLIPFAAGFADQILFLHEGVIFEKGPAETFLTSATRPETRAFLAAEQFLQQGLSTRPSAEGD